MLVTLSCAEEIHDSIYLNIQNTLATRDLLPVMTLGQKISWTCLIALWLIRGKFAAFVFSQIGRQTMQVVASDVKTLQHLSQSVDVVGSRLRNQC